MRRAGYLVLSALVVVLAGCADGDTGGTGPSTTGGRTSTGGTASTGAPSPTDTPTPSPRTASPDGRGPGTATSTVAPSDLVVTTVVDDLEAPWSVVFDADGRAFVSERDRGVVVEIRDDGPHDVHRFDVDAGGEGGLLGLAIAPDGSFRAYVTTATDNRVVRFRPGGATEPILTGIPKASFHDGGRLAFGPDGMLYVTTGDAGDPSRAQDPSSLAGKILRIRPDGSVPADNPDPGSPVYSLGHRNVQGLAWTADGTMYASEFGPDRDDEVNRIVAGGNYGWPAVTGEAGRAEFVDPVLVRQPPEAAWSGLAVARDETVPAWDGDLFVAALRGGRLWHVDRDADGTIVGAEGLLVGTYGRLRDVVVAPDDSLWVLTNNRDGRGSPRPGDDRILRLGPP